MKTWVPQNNISWMGFFAQVKKLLPVSSAAHFRVPALCPVCVWCVCCVCACKSCKTKESAVLGT